MPNDIPVLVECNVFDIANVREVLTEGRGAKPRKTLRLAGVVQKCDDVNENMRIYPQPVIQEAIGAIKDRVQSRQVLGELDHASDPKIHLDRVSHLMAKVWMEGKMVMGEVEVIPNTPCGNILSSLIESEVPISISSRGVGDMKPVMLEGYDQECYEVLPGFRFITWDIVADPSVSEAQLSVVESRQYRSGKLQRNMEREIATAIAEMLRKKNG